MAEIEAIVSGKRVKGEKKEVTMNISKVRRTFIDPLVSLGI